jgi:hypothetical protein
MPIVVGRVLANDGGGAGKAVPLEQSGASPLASLAEGKLF